MFTKKKKSLLKPYLNSCTQVGEIIHFSQSFFSSRWIQLEEQNKRSLRGGFYCWAFVGDRTKSLQGFIVMTYPLQHIPLKNPISAALFPFTWHLISGFGYDLSNNLKAHCITIFRGLNIQCWCMSPFDPRKTSAHARVGTKFLSLAALGQ